MPFQPYITSYNINIKRFVCRNCRVDLYYRFILFANLAMHEYKLYLECSGRVVNVNG